MAVCPFAVKKLIAPGSNDPRIRPRIAILHVDAGNAYDLHGYFDGRSGGIESHFHVAKDGTIFQYRDTDWEADANHRANPFAISIETQGYGEGEWTEAQLESIKRLLLWINEAHPAVPLRKVDRWDGAGVGYHIQFGTPGWWTPARKSCPGPDRIKQYDNIIVPWLNDGAPGTQPKEDDMAWNDPLMRWHPGDKDTTDEMPAGQQLNQARGYAQEAYASAKRTEAAVRALAKALGPTVEVAVEKALADSVVQVEVTVRDRE